MSRLADEVCAITDRLGDIEAVADAARADDHRFRTRARTLRIAFALGHAPIDESAGDGGLFRRAGTFGFYRCPTGSPGSGDVDDRNVGFKQPPSQTAGNAGANFLSHHRRSQVGSQLFDCG